MEILKQDDRPIIKLSKNRGESERQVTETLH